MPLLHDPRDKVFAQELAKARYHFIRLDPASAIKTLQNGISAAQQQQRWHAANLFHAILEAVQHRHAPDRGANPEAIPVAHGMDASAFWFKSLYNRDLGLIEEALNDLGECRTKNNGTGLVYTSWVEKLEADLHFENYFIQLKHAKAATQGGSPAQAQRHQQQADLFYFQALAAYEDAVVREIKTYTLYHLNDHKERRKAFKSLLSCEQFDFQNFSFPENHPCPVLDIMLYSYGLCLMWSNDIANITKAGHIFRSAARLSHLTNNHYYHSLALRELAALPYVLTYRKWKGPAYNSKTERNQPDTKFLVSKRSELIAASDDSSTDDLQDARDISLRWDYSEPVALAATRIIQERIRIGDLLSVPDNLLPEAFYILRWIPRPSQVVNSFCVNQETLLLQILASRHDAYEQYIEKTKDLGHAWASGFNVDNENRARDEQPNSAEASVAFGVIRGWASAVPLLGATTEGRRNPSTFPRSRMYGGGYVLKVGSDLIAIDPGFHFINNLAEFRIPVLNLRRIVVTHNHGDHNGDLFALDDIKYELASRLDEAKERPYTLYLDADTALALASRFGIPNYGEAKVENKFRSVFIMDDDKAGSSSISQSIIDLLGEKVKILSSNGRSIVTNDGSGPSCSLKSFKVKHQDDVIHSRGVSMTIRHGSKSVVFSYCGDCEYSEDIKHHVGDADYLLLHISQPSIQELLYDGRIYKRGHLGFQGVVRLVEDVIKHRSGKKSPPKEKIVILIGEFWGGKGDLRMPIMNSLRERFNTLTDQVIVLPAGQGLVLDLESRSAVCSKCETWVPLDTVRFRPSSGEYSRLMFLCRDCWSGEFGVAAVMTDIVQSSLIT